ncbi:MAG: hypothetical protein CVV47_15645 [Spirochaetae bacterium HGW-Spirochaetae-3]|jgi:3',5'-cyclic AMP phosphodiesterase CpdA|nr:MAG: hypothetical protein CVV47_15645 [Spirochaetae bacterium HGW-Spirochaetae-3]
MHSFPRRALLTLALGLASAAPCLAQAATPVFVISDLHYLAPALRDDGKAFRDTVMSGDGKDTGRMDALLDALERELPRPSILLVTGDLSLNGEEESHRALARRFEALGGSGVRVFVIPGNHDLENPWAIRFSGSRRLRTPSVSAERFRELYARSGYAAADSVDPSSLSYYATIDGGRAVLMIDSTISDDNMERGSPTAAGRLSASTLRWIDERLAEAARRGVRVIVGMHHSLGVHNAFLSEGYTLRNADELAAVLARRGQRFILSGHIHIQSVARVETTAGTVIDIATNALSVYPNSYGRVDIDAGTGEAGYVSRRVDVEGWARAAGVEDEYLRRFASASESYFGGFARRLIGDFGADDGLGPREAGLIGDFMAELNCGFFAGSIDVAERDRLRSSAGYAALAGLEGGFLSSYISSILDRPGVDMRTVTVDPRDGK